MLDSFFSKSQLLRELAIRVAYINEKNDENQRNRKFPAVVAMNVPSVLTVKELRKRLSGRVLISYESHLLYCGRVLNDDENLPLECFEYPNTVDEETEAFRPRLVLLIDCEIPSSTEQLEDIPVENSMLSHSIADTKEILEDEVWQADRQLLVEEHFRSLFQKSNFDLRAELNRIGCEVFYHELKRELYDNEVHEVPAYLLHFYNFFFVQGSFASLKPTDFTEKHIWIPERAKERILALSANVRSRLGLGLLQQDEIVVNKPNLLDSDILLKKKMIMTRQDLEESHIFRHASKIDFKFQETVRKQKQRYLELDAARFHEVLRIALNFPSSATDGDVMQFDLMVQSLQTLILKNKSANVNLDMLLTDLKNSCALNAEEICLRELCWGEKVVSVLVEGRHSKSKFVDAATQLLIKHHPDFFFGIHNP